ncbi:sterol desaturase family protein [Ramlibacter sp. PS4R-6]|uniref:sterol desaturase family protein n=1 Tax=Ramlibacter sp. PS4R-6 TaxID=3133438 RepID=UPI0030B513E9
MQVTDILLIASFLPYPVFLLLERFAAARWQPRVKLWKTTGLVFVALYAGVGVGLPLLMPASWFEHSLLPGAALGVAGGALVGFLVLTLVNYAWHRSVHRVPLLWRMFHQMHHSAQRLDVSGAFVFHPSEMAAYTVIAVVVTGPVLGLDPVAAAIVGFIGNFNAVFQHADIRTPAWIGWFVQRPEAHSVHHAYDVHAFNYSDFPLWDRLFGTYRAAGHFKPRVGFDDQRSGRWVDMAIARDVHAPDFSLAGAREGAR